MVKPYWAVAAGSGGLPNTVPGTAMLLETWLSI